MPAIILFSKTERWFEPIRQDFNDVTISSHQSLWRSKSKSRSAPLRSGCGWRIVEIYLKRLSWFSSLLIKFSEEANGKCRRQLSTTSCIIKYWHEWFKLHSSATNVSPKTFIVDFISILRLTFCQWRRSRSTRWLGKEEKGSKVDLDLTFIAWHQEVILMQSNLLWN